LLEFVGNIYLEKMPHPVVGRCAAGLAVISQSAENRKSTGCPVAIMKLSLSSSV
jgi:hypothetical protein